MRLIVEFNDDFSVTVFHDFPLMQLIWWLKNARQCNKASGDQPCDEAKSMYRQILEEKKQKCDEEKLLQQFREHPKIDWKEVKRRRRQLETSEIIL